MIDTLSERFKFISEALNGTGGFSPKVYTSENKDELTGATHLVQYPRESNEKFARRNKIAWYRNFLNPACVRFSGYLMKKPPQREIPNPLFAKMIEDIDWRGNDIDVFWNTFSVEAKARGSMLLLVDMPKVIPETIADQVKDRAFPYFAMIAPERVVGFELNNRGLFRIVAFQETITRDGVSIDQYRVFTENEWWVQKPGSLDDQSNIIEIGVHSLGICPVIPFTEAGDYPYVGSFAQIADMSKRYFNAASEQDEILRSQTFSLLTYQKPAEQMAFDAGSVAEAIGTHNMLIHEGDTPAFIAPPDGPATIYGEVKKDIEDNIRRTAMTVEQPNSSESGVALTIRFQELNSSLTAFARRMEDLERKAWDISSRWLTLNDTVKTTWPKSYELSDLQAEMNVLEAMQASGFPAEVIHYGMKHIVNLQYGTAEQEEIDKLNASIDGLGAEIQPTIDPSVA